ncbi:Uncharacterised protein [Klebsiella pneumoniae]|nr:Uncharacterised protein [Klebsiella pneumoniae]
MARHNFIAIDIDLLSLTERDNVDRLRADFLFKIQGAFQAN